MNLTWKGISYSFHSIVYHVDKGKKPKKINTYMFCHLLSVSTNIMAGFGDSCPRIHMIPTLVTNDRQITQTSWLIGNRERRDVFQRKSLCVPLSYNNLERPILFSVIPLFHADLQDYSLPECIFFLAFLKSLTAGIFYCHSWWTNLT